MMALYGTLVCDSENWCTYYNKLGSFFPVVCFVNVYDQTLAEQLYRDKGLFDQTEGNKTQDYVIICH